MYLFRLFFFFFLLRGVNYRFRRSVMKVSLSIHNALEGHTQVTWTLGCCESFYRAFLLSLYRAWQLHRLESLHLPVHPVTAAVLREAVTDILCSYSNTNEKH